MALLNENGNYLKIKKITYVNGSIRVVFDKYQTQSDRNNPDDFTKTIEESIGISFTEETLNEILTKFYNEIKNNEPYSEMDDA